jgi:hypothetical protein
MYLAVVNYKCNRRCNERRTDGRSRIKKCALVGKTRRKTGSKRMADWGGKRGGMDGKQMVGIEGGTRTRGGMSSKRTRVKRAGRNRGYRRRLGQ